MNKRLAQDLLSVFDTPKNVDIFNNYLDEKIMRAFSQLKGVSDPIEIYRLQGQISSFESMKKIRDFAVSVVKED